MDWFASVLSAVSTFLVAATMGAFSQSAGNDIYTTFPVVAVNNSAQTATVLGASTVDVMTMSTTSEKAAPEIRSVIISDGVSWGEWNAYKRYTEERFVGMVRYTNLLHAQKNNNSQTAHLERQLFSFMDNVAEDFADIRDNNSDTIDLSTLSNTTLVSPVFSGSIDSNLTLGSRYLTGDGDDEGIIIDGSGNVGIGTNAPSSRLTVAGDMHVVGGYRDSLGVLGGYGMVLQSTGTSTHWVATSTLGISGGGGGGSSFGSFIDVNELAVADFGSFSCDGFACTLNNGAVDISTKTNLSVGATGLGLAGDEITLSSGFEIPLIASTTNWNTAFLWGNHADAGYATSTNMLRYYTESVTTPTFVPTVSGILSVAIGNGAAVLGDNSLAFGSSSVTAHQSIAVGHNSQLTGVNGILIGNSNTASGPNTVTFGSSNVVAAAGSPAVAVGVSNTSRGTLALSVGFNNVASSTAPAAAFGSGNQVGNMGSAFGMSNTATGTAPAAAFGYANEATNLSGAFGLGNKALALSSFVFGNGITNNTSNSAQYGPSDAAKLTILGEVGRVGFVGIGTTTPSSKLSVVGDALITGQVSIGGLVLQGNSSLNNYLVNASVNVIGLGIVSGTIGGGGASPGRNIIGTTTLPYYSDLTPIDWSADVGYVAGAADYAVIVGGYDNINNQIAGSILGGGHSFIKYNSEGHSVIGGGSYNVISAGRSGIFNGTGNTITGSSKVYSFIGGGNNNNITGSYAVIPGGANNTVSGNYAGVIGGQNNTVGSLQGSVVGGYNNLIDAGSSFSAIIGGQSNTIDDGGATYPSLGAVILGGDGQTVTNGNYGAILGGYQNTVSNRFAVVVGGRLNTASGEYSLAAGRRAQAINTGSFALTDSADADFTVSAANAFGARFSGGYFLTGGNVGIGTSSPSSKLEIVDYNANPTAVTARLVNRHTDGKSIIVAAGDVHEVGFGVYSSNFPVPSMRNVGGFGASGAITVVSNSNIPSGGSDSIRFNAGGYDSEQMRLTAAGNLGIGTTTPQNTLTVAGTLAVSSLSSGRIPYATTGGQLIDNANLAYNGSNLILGSSGIQMNDVFMIRGAANRLDLALGDSINLLSGGYQIGGINVLTSSSLGSGITSSSLTSLGTLTSLVVSGSSTMATTSLTAALLDRAGSAGTTGMILRSIGTGTQWVATSSLGFAASFSNSSQLANLLSDETGTGNVVFSNSPALTGTLTGANANFSGNVGIGTTTPSSALDVNGTVMVGSSSSGRLSLRSSVAGGNWNYIQSGDGAGTTDSWQGLAFGSYNRAVNTAVPKMVIDASGNIGIGTSSPAAKLHVQVSGSFTPSVPADTSAVFAATGLSSSNNNVSIVSAVNGVSSLTMGDIAANSGRIQYTNNTDIMSFSIQGTERLSIDSAARLTVSGTILSTNLLGGATNIAVDAQGQIIRDPSDVRLKKNITDIQNALDTVLALRGVRYQWRDKEKFGDQTEIGFIAQEVDLVAPEVVSKGGEYWSLNTKNLVAVVVEAIQEMWDTVQGHGDRLDDLETENADLKARIEALEQEDNDVPYVPPVETYDNSPVVDDVSEDEHSADTSDVEIDTEPGEVNSTPETSE